jgi:hypothetical protein
VIGAAVIGAIYANDSASSAMLPIRLLRPGAAAG